MNNEAGGVDTLAAAHEIAVGTVIAHRPPRRPGRAQFGHPVLTSSVRRQNALSARGGSCVVVGASHRPGAASVPTRNDLSGSAAEACGARAVSHSDGKR